MNIQSVIERYYLDARSWEEKNSRSLARGKELLAAGKTGQAMRMFAYNHSLNQNKPAPASVPGGTKWKVRVWKNNKVVKTLTVDSDSEQNVLQKVKALNIDWDKATVHDPKTMKQTKKYANPNASKTSSGSSNPAKMTAPVVAGVKANNAAGMGASKVASTMKAVEASKKKEPIKIPKFFNFNLGPFYTVFPENPNVLNTDKTIKVPYFVKSSDIPKLETAKTAEELISIAHSYVRKIVNSEVEHNVVRKYVFNGKFKGDGKHKRFRGFYYGSVPGINDEYFHDNPNGLGKKL